MFAGTRAGVLRLVDLPEGVWGVAGLLDMQIRVLAVHPVHTQTLYAGTWGQGVYKSDDDGLTWQPKNTGLEDDALHVNALAFDPTNSEVMYAGTFGRGVYSSTDAGAHWYTWTTGLPEGAEVWSLGFAPDGTLFAGLRYDRTYKRVAVGPWQPAAFPYAALTLAMDPRTNMFYAGTWGGGVFRNPDGADASFEDWTYLGMPSDYFDLLAALFVGRDPAVLYVGTLGDGVYVSMDGGETWARRSQGLEGKSLTVWSLAASPDGQTLYAGTGDGVFFKPVDGERWESLGEQSPPNAGTLAVAHIRPETDVIYAGTRQNGLWKVTLGQPYPLWEGPLAFAYRDGVITKTHLSSLLVGDGSVYAGVWGYGLRRAALSDTDRPWSPVEMAPKYVGNLAVADKTVWQWGGKRFYATTERGLYGSRDGEDWEALPLGSVKALAVDPQHPQVVYASLLTPGSPDVGETEELTYTSEIMVSLNDGRTWRSIGALPTYVTHMARDPDDPQRLVALVADGGLYRGQVSLPWLWREVVVAWLMGLTAFGLVVVVPWQYANLLYTYGLSHRLAWGLMAHLPLLWRVRRRRFRKSLNSLAELILATVDQPTFSLVDVWENLDKIGVVTSRDRLGSALHTLTQQGLLREHAGVFRFPTPGLQAVAAVAFRQSDDQLLEEVRREHRRLNDVQRFFEAAGFDVRQDAPLNLTKFVLRPRRGLYRDYHRLYAWLQLKGRLKAEDVDDIGQEVKSDFPTVARDAGSPIPLAFFIGDEMPDVPAFRRMWMYQDRFRLVPLSLTTVRRALRGHSAARDVDRLVQQSSRQVDLYDLRSPVVDQLDFFGRQGVLTRLSASLKRGRSVDVCGLPSMGKTSLLWCLKESLVDPIVAYADMGYAWPGSHEFQARIIRDLTRDLWLKYDRFVETEEEATFETQLLSIAAAVPGDETWQVQVVLLLDDVAMTSAGERRHCLDALRRLAEAESAFALVVTWRDAALPLATCQILTPLDEQACATLVLSVGARMGLAFTPGSLLRIYQETGGHPFLLRQLGSAIVRQIPASHAPPESRQVMPAWVERALPAYLPMREDYFEGVWQWLSPDQQEAVRIWSTMTGEEREHGLDAYPYLRTLLLDEGGLDKLFKAWVITRVREDRL
jgi:photosystem II stability/assembly factor-like uncharacterized protein